jgi:DNA-binding beta-propeller fold protein YncE
VATDSKDNVYLMTRMDAWLIVYDRDGNFFRSWGEGLFTPMTHGIAIGPDDMVYTVDDGDHTVRKFTPEGKQLMMIGTPGKASDTGYDGKTHGSIKRGGPPFNRPTDVAVAPDGELYVCDGYGNARVHRFQADGTLIQSWGEPGSGPASSASRTASIAPDDRLVTDRENDRSHLRDGQPPGYVDPCQRPRTSAFGSDGYVYVSELWWRVGQSSFVHGEIKWDLPGRVSIFDLQGNVITRWGGADREAPGYFVAPHTLCLDSRGDMYVGEVTWTFGVSRGGVREDAHTFQKFARL